MGWMDWNRAIETNRQALMRILAALVAMAGLSAASPSHLRGGSPVARGGGDAVLPRRLRNAILRLLRPAEAAARRLVIVAARDVVPPPVRVRKPRPLPLYIEIPAACVARNGGTGITVPAGTLRRIGPDGRVVYLLPKPALQTPPVAPRKPARRTPSIAFPLFDPLRNPFARRRNRNTTVRIWPCDATVGASRLTLRLFALGAALDDLPRQALRYARWRERAAAPSPRRINRIAPLRPGRPPGWRKPDTPRAHAVHGVLDTTHGLALWAMERPRRDSS